MRVTKEIECGTEREEGEKGVEEKREKVCVRESKRQLELENERERVRERWSKRSRREREGVSM